ncbi:hypothetical protein [Sandaracinobacteroides hominis]|uniref:hypothetical protein n=1 Tax=Sandaracinobacteroides hominis TaxID=2780086 RepID=UPI0018F50A45|nr:hypothetical protein [Sandaracinobacteroides hominis]
MWRRAFLSLLAVLGVLASSLHAPAMAVTTMPVRVQSAPVSAIPSEHACPEMAAKAAAAKQVKPTSPARPEKLGLAAAKAPQKSDCCGDGCDNACSPVAAFFAAAPQRVLSFLRSVVEAEAVAKAPARRIDGSERPPRPDA